MVSSYEELLVRGKDKLGLPAAEPVRVVLEADGTQIEDGEYFRTLANNTVLLLLRQGERWYPTGVDVIKAGERLLLRSFNSAHFQCLFCFSNIRHSEDRVRDHPCARAAR